MPHELAERLTNQVAERVQELDGEITKAEQEVRDRLAPLNSEREELQGLLARMRGESTPAARDGRRTRARRRRNGAGKRADEFVQYVKDHPGAKVAEIAKAMGMENANYLYRVAADEVDKTGRLRKEGTQYFVTAKGEADGEETS